MIIVRGHFKVIRHPGGANLHLGWYYYNGDDGVEETDDILGVICDVDALSLRWRSPENCHDMFES